MNSERFQQISLIAIVVTFVSFIGLLGIAGIVLSILHDRWIELGFILILTLVFFVSFTIAWRASDPKLSEYQDID